MVGKKENLNFAWAALRKNLDIDAEVGLNGTKYLGCTQTDFVPTKEDLKDKIEMYRHIFKADDGVNDDLKKAHGKAACAVNGCIACTGGAASVPPIAGKNTGGNRFVPQFDTNPDMSKVKAYEYQMEGFSESCVEEYCELRRKSCPR